MLGLVGREKHSSNRSHSKGFERVLDDSDVCYDFIEDHMIPGPDPVDTYESESERKIAIHQNEMDIEGWDEYSKHMSWIMIVESLNRLNDTLLQLTQASLTTNILLSELSGNVADLDDIKRRLKG